MTAHRTAGQLRALRELCALARTGLDVCDLLAERGAEESPTPRGCASAADVEAYVAQERQEQLGASIRARREALDVSLRATTRTVKRSPG